MNKEGSQKDMLKPMEMESRAVTPLSMASYTTAGSGSTVMFDDDVPFCKAFISPDSATKMGQRVQMVRVLVVLFLPIIGMAGYAANSLRNAIDAEIRLKDMRLQIEETHSIGTLVHAIQLERAETVLFLVSNKTFITAQLLQTYYENTNEMIKQVAHWPEDQLTASFKTKLHFRQYLDFERQLVLNSDASVHGGIIFYNNANEIFMDLLTTSLTDLVHGTLWKLLVAYKMVTRAKENIGVTVAIGIEYYMFCSTSESDRVLFIRNDVLGEDHLNTSMHYDPLIRTKLAVEVAQVDQLEEDLKQTSYDITNGIFQNCSQTKGIKFFDETLIYLEILKGVTTNVEERLLSEIDVEIGLATRELIIALVIFLALLVISPFLVIIVHRMTAAVQAFAVHVKVREDIKIRNKE